MKIIGIEETNQNKREQERKKVIITGIVSIILITIFIIVCIYIANRNFRDFIDKYVLMKNVVENNVISISLDESETNFICSYDKNICVLNQNILTSYNASGKKENELNIEITNPIIDANGRFLLIAEKNGQRIYLISGNNILWENEIEGNISRISVNKNGYASVIITGTTYKSIIQTFDNSGKTLFKTYLSNSIAMDSDISYDNKYLSFAEISTNGTLVQSLVKTISIAEAQEKPIETITTKNNSTIINLKYQEGNRIVCMYDNSICSYHNKEEQVLLNLQEEGQRISFADVELTNYALRVLEKSSLLNNNSTVELVNTSNKRTNIYTIDSIIKEIYVKDHIIALNLGSEVHFIGTNGWLNRKYISSQEINKIVLNDNFAGIVYRDKIEIVEW